MVKVERTTESFQPKVDTYEKGDSTTQEDGYLLVHAENKTIAQYAPGSWEMTWLEDSDA